MKKSCFTALLVCGACLLAGCQSTKDSEMDGLRRDMRNQMMTLRAQLQAAGATAAQLREFDKATAAMNRTMTQVERQMRLVEKQQDDR